MFPQTQTKQPANLHETQPTSPWTEAYHACSFDQSEQRPAAAPAQRPYDADTQSPTHDALSAIYNEGY